MFKFGKKLLGILIVSALLISMVTATAHAVSTQETADKKDTGIVKIESKEKTTKYKITWNGNGGKIGSKKTTVTTVKKGSKIGKLVTPKRSGYSFKGWYTKKTGGTKITKSTKPKKSATLYARWTKKPSSRVLNAAEKKLLGRWSDVSSTGGVYDSGSGAYQYAVGNGIWYTFEKDGTFTEIVIIDTSISRFMQVKKGSWHISGNTVYMTNGQYQKSNDGGKTFTPWMRFTPPNGSMKIQHGSDEKGQYFTDVEYDGVKHYKAN